MTQINNDDNGDAVGLVHILIKPLHSNCTAK